MIEDEPEETPQLSDDLFESFDVDQLIDVVPQSQITVTAESPPPVKQSVIESLPVEETQTEKIRTQSSHPMV